MSGILVDDGVVTEWNNMKLKHKYNFMTFSVFEDKVIVVDDKGKKSYDDFVSLFDAQHCKYAVVEVPGTTKLVFVLWAPDNAPVKEKMIYAASRQGTTALI